VHNPPVNERPATRLELLLGHDRASLVVLLILFPLVCWSWIVVMAHDMSGPMTGASAWMMTVHWDARHVFLLWAMWAVMMVGMMLPSAAPLLLLYGVAVRRQGRGLAAARQK
jgi:predicted metal-binding membrane protein